MWHIGWYRYPLWRNELPEPPFRVFDSPGCPFLPKPPFRVFDLSGYFMCSTFDYVCVRRVRQIVAVHGGQNHCPTRKYALDHKQSFISRSAFSPGITLRQDDPLAYKISSLIYLTPDLLVESLDHPFLIRLTMTNISKSLLVDQVKLIKPSMTPIVFT